MPFCFNFNIEEASRGHTSEKGEDDGHTKEEVNKWFPAEEIFLSQRHHDKISAVLSVEVFQVVQGSDTRVEEEEEKMEVDKNSGCVSGEEIGVVSTSKKVPQPRIVALSFLNSETVAVNLRENSYEGPLTPALEGGTDLVPAQYEGGLKIWECSEDLVRYLGKTYSSGLAGKRVLELGCGAGLPGIYCFSQGASVDFSDYNREVLEELTMPNVLLNVPMETMTTTDHSLPSPPETRFFAGDWAALDKDILEPACRGDDHADRKYDLILTSETIYNVDNQAKLIAIFKHCLKHRRRLPDGTSDDNSSSSEGGGEILLAAKSVYFGVGGGLQEFRRRMEREGFEVETVAKSEAGVSRHILRAVLK